MGKKKNSKKQGSAKGIEQGEKVIQFESRADLLRFRNDEAMFLLEVVSTLQEDQFNWDGVTDLSETIACDACPYDDTEPDGLKPEDLWIVRSEDDYWTLAALAHQYPDKGKLDDALQATRKGILLRQGRIPFESEIVDYSFDED